MRRRTIGIASAVVLVLVVAVPFMRRGGSGVAVDVQPAARKAEFRSSVTASGQIVAQRYADIGSSVMGRLVELRVKEGDMVTAGQVLARIDAVQATASASAAGSPSQQVYWKDARDTRPDPRQGVAASKQGAQFRVIE